MPTSNPIVHLAAVALLLTATTAVLGGEASTAPTPNAFATIGPALVQGNFHQYPPFYGSVITPHAFVAKGHIFCAFQDTKGLPVVMAYDVAAGKWKGPAYASDFGLGKDAHGNPSVCLDRHGHIHVFYGCHGGRLRHARSKKPYEIDDWEEQSSPTPRATYPQTMRMANGDIYLFYRAGGHMAAWTFRRSADDGGSWSEGEKIVEMRLAPPDPLSAAYCSFHPGSDGRTVHGFWVHKDDNAARVRKGTPHPWRPLKYPHLHEAVYRYNMYYIRRDADGLWRTATDEEVRLPVSKADADARCLVFDSGDEFTNIGRPIVDEMNRPHVSFRYGVGDWKAGGGTAMPWRQRYAHYADGRWHVSDRIPDDWPETARSQAAAAGSIAFGDPAGARWSIYYRNDRYNPESATEIFLEHHTNGFATRTGGPAKLP